MSGVDATRLLDAPPDGGPVIIGGIDVTALADEAWQPPDGVQPVAPPLAGGGGGVEAVIQERSWRPPTPPND